MASSGKRKTTMAKLNRERRLRERRLDKQARKDARKEGSAHDSGQPGTGLSSDLAETGPGAGELHLHPVPQTLPDA